MYVASGPQNIRRAMVFVAIAGWAVACQAGPGTESHGPSQIAADILREAAGAEIAFLPAGMVRESFSADNLATLLRYPTDELAIVNLKGSQIRSALERSVSLYPAPNDSFLQLSNLEVVFSRKSIPDSRIVSVTVAGQALDETRVYQVAMPATLARGGLGYFKVWDKKAISKLVKNVTLEQVLAGRRAGESAPRWRVQG